METIWRLFFGRAVRDVRGEPLCYGSIAVYECLGFYAEPEPLTTYSDPECTVANEHPVILDSEGRVPPIYVKDCALLDINLRGADGGLVRCFRYLLAPKARAKRIKPKDAQLTT